MDASGFLSATSAPQEEAGGQTETEDRSGMSVRSPLLRVVGKLEAIAMASASALAVAFKISQPTHPLLSSALCTLSGFAS
jgi:aryl-alcohol dehydrogenase-like predicted oxidoreductase